MGTIRTDIPFFKILISILPGGVTHSLDGFCIAVITIPVTPTTPLNVKNPPIINAQRRRLSAAAFAAQHHTLSLGNVKQNVIQAGTLLFPWPLR